MSPGPVRSGPGPPGPRRSPPPASEAWRWHSAREGPGSRGRAENGRSVTGLGSRCQPGHPARPDLASWTRSRAVVPPACGACSCSSAWSLGFCLAPPGPPLIRCCSEPFLAFLPRTRPHFSGFHCQTRTRSVSWRHLQSEGHFRPGPWLRRRCPLPAGWGRGSYVGKRLSRRTAALSVRERAGLGGPPGRGSACSVERRIRRRP